MRRTAASTETAPPWGTATREVAVWLGRAPRSALLELTTRIGFAARGVVYLSIGILAFLAAMDLAPRAQGVVKVMAGWGRWPAGTALIWLTAVGLCFFTLWRGLQAVLDADGCGRSPRGVAARVGQAISGVTHGVLAWSLFGLLDGLEDLNERDDADSAQAAAEMVLGLPHGDLVLTAAGGIVLAFAAGSIGQGLLQDFAKRLGCSPAACRWGVALARFGYVGRGVAIAPMGLFLAEAGLDARASRVQDFGGALQALEGQPFGELALASTGAGLVAFGLFALFEAGYRRIAVPVREPAAATSVTQP